MAIALRIQLFKRVGHQWCMYGLLRTHVDHLPHLKVLGLGLPMNQTIFALISATPRTSAVS
jgi:hypothetical protein